MKNKFEIIDKISIVHSKTENCKLKNKIFISLEDELNQLSSYFQITTIETFFLSTVFSLNYKYMSTVSFSNICDHFNCNPMRLLKYADVFDSLVKKGFLIEEPELFSLDIAFAKHSYSVDQSLSRDIINNNKIGLLQGAKQPKVIDFLEQIFIMSEKCENDKMTTSVLKYKCNALIKQNQHLDFIKKISFYKLDIIFSFLYYFLIWETLTGTEETDIETAIGNIIKSPTYKIRLIQEFINENKNKLITQELIEINEAEFINNSTMRLTQKSLSLLEEEGIKLFNKQKKRNLEGIIQPDDIFKLDLFYNKEEEHQLAMIRKSLGVAKYKELQKRLKSKNLPTGVTILMYGAPGTGKTESVLQIAKQTGREIMKVDISQSKSFWYGESEKIVKKIFTQYDKLKRISKRTPILLFNEADAILSKRRDVNSSSISQTENAIQNIILEEMEKFDGIFMATTNLVSNLDSAFERRFLFKVEFSKPDIDVKIKIWKSKLKRLSKNECKVLADKFDFTGGQINNIARKCEMLEVIEGEETNFERILEFCSVEKLSNQHNLKIGFTNK